MYRDYDLDEIKRVFIDTRVRLSAVERELADLPARQGQTIVDRTYELRLLDEALDLRRALREIEYELRIRGSAGQL